MTKTRIYYEDKLSQYPDVVDLLTFRQMMGGIGDTFARRLIHEGRVRHLLNRTIGFSNHPLLITC